jgi:hypothetical protein
MHVRFTISVEWDLICVSGFKVGFNDRYEHTILRRFRYQYSLYKMQAFR